MAKKSSLVNGLRFLVRKLWNLAFQPVSEYTT